MTHFSEAELRPFQPQQADELVAVWRASFEQGVGILDPHPLHEQREYLLSQVVPNFSVCTAIQAGRLVGFAAATQDSISQLYVHVDCQRQGIGTQLLNWSKQRSQGTLWLYTFEQNTGARRFYERHGFTVVERGFEPTWQLADLKYQWKRSAGTE